MANPSEVLHLTPKEVAARLRMNVGSLNNWRRQGRGPRFIKYGSKVLYPLDELEKWEKENTFSSGADAHQSRPGNSVLT